MNSIVNNYLYLKMSIPPQVQTFISGNNLTHTPVLPPWIQNTIQPNMQFFSPTNGIIYTVVPASTQPFIILPPPNHNTNKAKAPAKKTQKKKQQATDNMEVRKPPHDVTRKQPQNRIPSIGNKRPSPLETTTNKREKKNPPEETTSSSESEHQCDDNTNSSSPKSSIVSGSDVKAVKAVKAKSTAIVSDAIEPEDAIHDNDSRQPDRPPFTAVASESTDETSTTRSPNPTTPHGKKKPLKIQLMKPYFHCEDISDKAIETRVGNTPYSAYRHELSISKKSYVAEFNVKEQSLNRKYTFNFEIDTYCKKYVSFKNLQLLIHALLANDNEPMTNVDVYNWVQAVHKIKGEDFKRNLMINLRTLPDQYPDIITTVKMEQSEARNIFRFQIKLNKDDFTPVKTLALQNMLPKASPDSSIFAAMKASGVRSSSVTVTAPVTTPAVPSTPVSRLAVNYSWINKQQK